MPVSRVNSSISRIKGVLSHFLRFTATCVAAITLKSRVRLTTPASRIYHVFRCHRGRFRSSRESNCVQPGRKRACFCCACRLIAMPGDERFTISNHLKYQAAR